MSKSTQSPQKAEAQFKKKELQRLDGNAARAEYEAARKATAEKTIRLKALRLARDAVAASEEPSAAKTEKAPRATQAEAPAKLRRRAAKARPD
ncbi:MAG: hypothetical protein ACJ8F3_01855 [Xanthobacteraceae bacterium]